MAPGQFSGKLVLEMVDFGVMKVAALRREMGKKGRSADARIPNFSFLCRFRSVRGTGCERGMGRAGGGRFDRRRSRDARRTIFKIRARLQQGRECEQGTKSPSPPPFWNMFEEEVGKAVDCG